jgi:thiol-disulfide isomerase/thioredoxin
MKMLLIKIWLFWVASVSNLTAIMNLEWRSWIAFLFLSCFTVLSFSFTTPMPKFNTNLMSLRPRGLAEISVQRSTTRSYRQKLQLKCQVAEEVSGPSIRTVKSEADLDSLLQNGLVVLELSATHCRKCVALASKYKSLADSYVGKQNIVFAKLVVDELKELAQLRFNEVKVTPTFHLYQAGVKVDETVRDC